MYISEYLKIDKGLTAVIGGGGKTSLIYTLARELGQYGTVVLATSTHIRVPEQYPLVTGSEDELRAALEIHRVICAGSPADDGKLTAPPVSFERLSKLSDYLLVEADGSKGLPLKRHALYEPVIPENAGKVVLVVGADAFNKPLFSVCHRASEKEIASPSWIAEHIIKEGYGDCVYINKAETEEDYAAAAELAALLSCPVIAGSLMKGEYRCLRSFAAQEI